MKCIFNSYCSCPLQWPVHGLDVVAALDWIYDNIAQYGGDPRQVGNGLCVFVTPSGCCLMASLIFRFLLIVAGFRFLCHVVVCSCMSVHLSRNQSFIFIFSLPQVVLMGRSAGGHIVAEITTLQSQVTRSTTSAFACTTNTD